MAGYIFPFHRNLYAARGKISKHTLDWRTLFDLGCYTVNGEDAYSNGGPFVTGGLLSVTRSDLFAQQELRCITGEVYSRMNPTGEIGDWTAWRRRDLEGVVATAAPAPSPAPGPTPGPAPIPVGAPSPVSSVGPNAVEIYRELGTNYYDGIATVFNGPITRIDLNSGNMPAGTTVTYTGNTVVFSGTPASAGAYGALWVITTPYGSVTFHITTHVSAPAPVGSPVGFPVGNPVG